MSGRLRDALLQKMKPAHREITERIRSALRGQRVEDILRRFSKSGEGNAITEEDLIIGVSKLNANLYLGDLNECIKAIKAATGSQDNQLPLRETL